jgi:hypothetical protein
MYKYLFGLGLNLGCKVQGHNFVLHFSLQNHVLFLFSIILTLSVATSTLCYNGQGSSHRGSNPLHNA